VVTARGKKGRKGTACNDVFMPFDELWRHVGGGRNQLYERLKDGTFPTLKLGRLRKILRKPTEAILRGEAFPEPVKPASAATQHKANDGLCRQAGAP
jgi:hypothetical protein